MRAADNTTGYLFDVRTWPTKAQFRTQRRRRLESALEQGVDAVAVAANDRIPVVAAGRDDKFRDERFKHFYFKRGER
jgi:hypothetical protein